MVLGRVWEAFGRLLGGFWETFGRLLAGFGRVWSLLGALATSQCVLGVFCRFLLFATKQQTGTCHHIALEKA